MVYGGIPPRAAPRGLAADAGHVAYLLAASLPVPQPQPNYGPAHDSLKQTRSLSEIEGSRFWDLGDTSPIHHWHCLSPKRAFICAASGTTESCVPSRSPAS